MGDPVIAGEKTDVKPGNAMLLSQMPVPSAMIRLPKALPRVWVADTMFPAASATTKWVVLAPASPTTQGSSHVQAAGSAPSGTNYPGPSPTGAVPSPRIVTFSPVLPDPQTFTGFPR